MTDEITTRLAYALWDATHTIKMTFPEDIEEHIKKAQNVRWWLERNVVLTLKSAAAPHPAPDVTCPRCNYPEPMRRQERAPLVIEDAAPDETESPNA